jgi:hypothetical protein
MAHPGVVGAPEIDLLTSRVRALARPLLEPIGFAQTTPRRRAARADEPAATRTQRRRVGSRWHARALGFARAFRDAPHLVTQYALAPLPFDVRGRVVASAPGLAIIDCDCDDGIAITKGTPAAYTHAPSGALLIVAAVARK